jgi:thiol-disulfide isomerase/thioredoxin
MIKALLHILFLLLLPFLLKSQSVDILVNVLQGFSPQAKLYIFNGTDLNLVDSTSQIKPGVYAFSLPSGYKQGLYRISIGKGISIDFVVSDEPLIDISTVVFAPEDSLKSKYSQENNIYWKYQKEKKRSSQINWLLNSLIDFYPDSIMFHHLLVKETENHNRELYELAKTTYQRNPNLFSAKLILTEQPPFSQSYLYDYENVKLIKEIWWQNIDLLDTRLLNSPFLANRLWRYIELIFSDDFDMEEQEESFINAISELMQMDMHVEIKNYFRAVLIDGFAKSDYQVVVDFLETDDFNGLKPIREAGIGNYHEKSPRIKVGDKAYDFFIYNTDIKRVKLSKLKSKYKLLVFWSTWCPHCIEALPKIAKIYEKYSNEDFEVIAISIDDDKNLWQEYVKKLNLNWINICEPYTSDSKMLMMYNVEETPKMYLLSNDLTIISRPATIRQLEVKLRRLTN